jgi:MCP family monocarboxylic acid transporter-like MFS transporter 10
MNADARHRCCYAIALSISSNEHETEPLGSWKRLLDFTGFLDRRYAVLAAGAFLAMLGQFIPYYYISKQPTMRFPTKNLLAIRTGSYMTAVHPVSPAKDYLLPLMNASSFLGRIL